MRISDHAIDRYYERSGSKYPRAVVVTILGRMWENGVSVSKTLEIGDISIIVPDDAEHRRHDDWVLVGQDEVVLTCYPYQKGRFADCPSKWNLGVRMSKAAEALARIGSRPCTREQGGGPGSGTCIKKQLVADKYCGSCIANEMLGKLDVAENKKAQESIPAPKGTSSEKMISMIGANCG